MKRFVERHADRVFTLLRVVAGLLFACHGAQKLFGFPAAGPPHLDRLMLAAAVIEFAGGILIALGLFTRPVAVIASGEMAVAYFMAHAPKGFWPVVNGGELAVLYCFVWLYVAARGGGRFSLDALWRRGRP